ncbi:MAG: STAS domain-containing protein [Ruminococcus sp.]|nr:STAS domain-containing protein [Ruminococcus sp.]
MLKINKIIENGHALFTLSGRLDTTTAPELDQELRSSLTGVTTLTLDMKDLSYISSAGLRVLLSAQKLMNKQGKMTVCNVNETVYEIFEVTGFSDILDIERAD